MAEHLIIKVKILFSVLSPLMVVVMVDNLMVQLLLQEMVVLAVAAVVLITVVVLLVVMEHQAKEIMVVQVLFNLELLAQVVVVEALEVLAHSVPALVVMVAMV
jgi:hypothetical protein